MNNDKLASLIVCYPVAQTAGMKLVATQRVSQFYLTVDYWN